MSNFHQLHNSLIDMDRVRLIRPIFNGRENSYVSVVYHDHSEDCIDCEDPEKVIKELTEVLNKSSTARSKAVTTVVNAALTWDVLFKSRQTTIPEDDDLHFAVQYLLTIEDSLKEAT